MTIHKSQGQTFHRVAVYIQPSFTRALLYVGMSRATKLDGLFLFGQRSIVSRKIAKMSREQRKKIVENREKSDPVKIEMKRLRKECLLDNFFKFLGEDYEKPALSIMFHNVRSFKAHKNKINNDRGFKNTDILLLVETHLNIKHLNLLDLDGYILINATYSQQLNSSNGQLCYIKENLFNNITFIGNNANLNEYNQTDILELSILKYKLNENNEVFILYLYKHPNYRMKNLLNELKQFLTSHKITKNDKIYIFGDFNYDFNENQLAFDILEKEVCVKPLKVNTSTHESGSQIDWCFTNETKTKFEEKLCNYESWFSDHNPLYLEII